MSTYTGRRCTRGGRPGATLGALAEGAPCSRQAVSQHLALLEGAGLLHTQWQGREKHHYLNPGPLAALPGPWLDAERFAAAQAALQHALQLARGSAVPTADRRTTPAITPVVPTHAVAA